LRRALQKLAQLGQARAEACKITAPEPSFGVIQELERTALLVRQGSRWNACCGAGR
jgi:hypothetical protein